MTSSGAARTDAATELRSRPAMPGGIPIYGDADPRFVELAPDARSPTLRSLMERRRCQRHHGKRKRERLASISRAMRRNSSAAIRPIAATMIALCRIHVRIRPRRR